MDEQTRLDDVRRFVKTVVGIFAGLTVFMVAGYAIQRGYLLPEGKDAITYLFSPIGYTLGLLIALKWEGVGGLVNLASVIGWHVSLSIVQGSSIASFAIYLLALPGLVFIGLWFAARKERREREARDASPMPDQRQSGA